VAVAVSATEANTKTRDEIESVAEDVSSTGALNVLAATASESVAVAVSETDEINNCAAEKLSVAVAVSDMLVANLCFAEKESVAVAASDTEDKNVTFADIASVAVAVSETADRYVKREDTLSVAVAVSATDALYTELPSDENGDCENVVKPNTRHAPLLSDCRQVSFSKPALLRLTCGICPLNQVEHVAIVVHAHTNHWALRHNARQFYDIAFFECCHD
jgi:rRNA maturation endonuclease Nob1